MKKLQDLEQIEQYYHRYKMERLFTLNYLNEFELIKVNRLEYICFQEELMEYLYFLVEGRAKVFKSLANGKTLLISFYEPFEVIGDVELIREMSAVCTVQALETCYLLALPIEKFRMSLQKDIKLLNFVCNALAEKLDHISHNSSINLLYPLENRLANYIDMTAVRLEKSDRGRCFNENLTQLAELLGISYRHLLRTLNGLCQGQILTRQKEGYIIINEVELKKLVEVIYK
ncbi:MAG: cyclic nucleotide-binding domain-containing protein [Cellulosilyticum sp.]|nr:cyclic nucleotide-binding domain-containing protein [Cellulosilyticum sp.]MEE1072143.1 cyclic nucleotide-binding domain-containing protein [Cellulosilyticum sp.]